MSQQDTISVRNWTISIFAGAGIAILLVVLILLFNKLGTVDRQEPKELRYERIKPVGQVSFGEIISITPVIETVSEPKSGDEVYEAVCKACHMLGVAGAPKFGDKAAWTDRIAKGEETLLDHALNGFNTMPARGGNPDLSDEEVKRAVQYMLAAVGVDSAAEEEATPAAAETVTPEASTPAEGESATSEPEAEATSPESSSETTEEQSAAETVTPEAATSEEGESATSEPEAEATSESSSPEVTEETATAPATPAAVETVTPEASSVPVDEEPAAGEADATPSDEATTPPESSDDSAALSTESVKVTSSEEASKKKTWAELAAEGVVSSQKVSEIETAEMTSKKKIVSELSAAEEGMAAATETPTLTQEGEKAAAEVTSTEIAAATPPENNDQEEANETTGTDKSMSTTETPGTDPEIKVDEVATTAASDGPVVATQAEPATRLDLTPFDLARGEQVYNTICTMCHNTGLVGAPKLGDKDSWTPRVAQGLEVLFTHSLQGFKGQTGVMPPKGGQIQVPDEDIKAAVAYMVSKAQ